MPSILSWIDHNSEDRERTLRILSFFQEKESRDELGLGSVRDSFADQLFPGTSTLQTRLRYMLFVPWIYRSLEEKKIPADKFATEAGKTERDLIQPLIDSNDQTVGVFGKTSGKGVKRLPSSVYWTGLGIWEIRLTPFSQHEYHKRIDEIYRSRNALKTREKEAKSRGDDIDFEQRKNEISWHPKLPQPPKNFPSEADFTLSQEEAEFIKDRIQCACPNSLLSVLALSCKPVNTNAPWKHPDYSSFSKEHKELLTHARLFSEVMHGAALSYNFQLAKLLPHDDLVSKHQASFNNWAKNLPLREIENWDIDRLWKLTQGHKHKITPRTTKFVEQWVNYVQKDSKNLLINTGALNLIEKREMKLKGTHSRFKNRRALEQWSGYSGLRKFDYRWSNVKVLLNDLCQVSSINCEEK